MRQKKESQKTTTTTTTQKRKTKKRGRTLTVLVVPANHPDEIDGMGFEERRYKGGGWTEMALLHPGEPDVLVRRGLDLDQGVYGAAPEWDREAKCVVQTSLIAADDLEHAAEILKPHVSKPKVLAQRLIDFAKSDEDPVQVALALKKEMTKPAAGPAEEAASYIRVFLGYVAFALEWEMGIAWEHRTPASCECAVHEGTTRGKPAFSTWLFETLEKRTNGGRLRCTQCHATFSYELTDTRTTVTREP